MGKGCGRVNTFKTVLPEWKAFEEWRSEGERVNGRANVVNEAGQRQFSRSRSTAYRIPRFEDADRPSSAGHFNGCGKAVWARADDNRVEFHRRIVYAMPNAPAASPM